MEAETDKPPMPDELRPIALAAQARHQRRPTAPAIALPSGDHVEALECPYREEDWALWASLLLECFGTRTLDVGAAFMRQLADLCPKVWFENEARSRPPEQLLTQAMLIVASFKPRNEAEAALAAQAVAVHFAVMMVGRTIALRNYTDPRTVASLAAAAKAYAGTLEAMRRLKTNGGRRQKIKVEKHVHIHSEKHVHLPGEGGGNFGGQAHGQTGERARARALLPSPDEGGDIVSLSADEGPDPMPLARRRKGNGSAEG